jgi:hypothetical protein
VKAFKERVRELEEHENILKAIREVTKDLQLGNLQLHEAIERGIQELAAVKLELTETKKKESVGDSSN